MRNLIAKLLSNFRKKRSDYWYSLIEPEKTIIERALEREDQLTPTISELAFEVPGKVVSDIYFDKWGKGIVNIYFNDGTGIEFTHSIVDGWRDKEVKQHVRFFQWELKKKVFADGRESYSYAEVVQ